MEEKIKRINELYHKSKAEGLTEVEKKEHLLTIFGALFDDNYFKKTLKIPVDYIKGFQYYCIEDKNFTEVLKSKNKTKIEFLIVPLAAKYNEIITDEN